MGGVITSDFVEILSEDHGEVLREGEFGDSLVKIEDQIIGASLQQYQGPQRDGVLRLFHFFAVFPEDKLCKQHRCNIIAISV